MPKTDRRARDRNCIEHILRYCEQVGELLAEIQQDRDRFLASRTYQNAIAMCILQIGELVKRLSDDFMHEYKNVPWKLIAKTRDNYAHHYGSVDFEMVWTTAVYDLPAVEQFCKKYLKEDSPKE